MITTNFSLQAKWEEMTQPGQTSWISFFSPNAWHNLVRCSQRCHWRFISSQRASRSRQKILLLSCIVWSVVVWNCILPHSLQFLLHQLYSKMVRKTKKGSKKQCCPCSFWKILWHNVRVLNSVLRWKMLPSATCSNKNLTTHLIWEVLSITYWFCKVMFYFLSLTQNLVSGLLPKYQNRNHPATICSPTFQGTSNVYSCLDRGGSERNVLGSLVILNSYLSAS